MPIVVKPEDIRLPKKKLKKDILYRLGLEEGKQIGEVEFAQKMVITFIEAKLGYVPEGLEERLREIKDREFLHALIKKLISSEDILGVLKIELSP